ncbi:MAG: 50S ribosomal protein L25 [Candidatus Marinimicrobia bacterium]|nr:50S ribosomal protein L25 [Candidatus Neomarinimicrobiota bacterium]
MVDEFKLELERRSELGKQAVKRLRKEGKIPGIFYSGESKAIPFFIYKKHLHNAFQSHSRVFAVTVGDKKVHAIFKEIQHHPVTDEVLHIDLFGIRLKDKIDINIPIVIIGEAIGVKNSGGILSQNLMELSIRCQATDVPESVEVDVTELDLGSSIHAKDLDLGKSELLTNPDVTIVSVLVPREEIVEEELEIEELEAVEEVEVEEEKPSEEGKSESSSQ